MLLPTFLFSVISFFASTLRACFSRLFGIIVFVMVLLLVVGASMPVRAQQAPVGVESPSWILLDGDSGQVLTEHNANDERAIASLTKLMTTLVVFRAIEEGRLHWNQMVTVPPEVKQLGDDTSKMYLIPGRQISVKALMDGLIIVSANDAAVTLAVAESGSLDRFIQKMNTTAASLGMTHSHFKNVDGLTEPGHYSTARDLGKVALEVAKEFPDYFQISSQPSFVYGGFHGKATNSMVGPNSTVDGMKTGYTAAAGYCVIASELRTMPDGSSRRIYAVVLGTNAYSRRFTDAQTLLNYAYNYFHDVRVANAGIPMAELPVSKGSAKSVGVTVDHDVVLSMPSNIPSSKLKAEIIANKAPLVGPIRSGQEIGKYQITLGGHVISTGSVYATEPVGQAGIISRVFTSLGSLFSSSQEARVPLKIG